MNLKANPKVDKKENPGMDSLTQEINNTIPSTFVPFTSSKSFSDFNHIDHFTQIQSMLHPGTNLNTICGQWKIVKVIKS